MTSKKTVNTRFAQMRSASAWKNGTSLRNCLADHLKHGRLALVLGAGVSMGCKLPPWGELIRRMFKNEGKTVPKGQDLFMQAEMFFKTHCGSSETRFAEKTQSALYQSYKTDAAALAEHKLLTALGAMMMGSRRGSVRSVITFNFDDLLETYLSYFGYVVDSIDNLPVWSSRADVEVYHPHGLLKSREPVATGSSILMTRSHFDAEANNAQSLKKAKMRDILSSHVCLFIGVSGDDDNLMKLLEHARTHHVCNNLKLPYWGVRFSTNKKDPKLALWESKGVVQWTVADYDRVPDELFRICQGAAEMQR